MRMYRLQASLKSFSNETEKPSLIHAIHEPRHRLNVS